MYDSNYKCSECNGDAEKSFITHILNHIWCLRCDIEVKGGRAAKMQLAENEYHHQKNLCLVLEAKKIEGRIHFLPMRETEPERSVWEFYLCEGGQ